MRARKEILDRNRDAVQRPAIAARADLGVRLSRLPQRQLGSHRDERVQLRVEAIDSTEHELGQLDSGDTPRTQQRADLGDRREFEGFRHSASVGLNKVGLTVAVYPLWHDHSPNLSGNSGDGLAAIRRIGATRASRI
jgi:hypothetical protein